GRSRRSRGGTHRRREDYYGGRRRRHGRGAQCRRRGPAVHLCLDRRRRLPRMAGGQAFAGGRGAQGQVAFLLPFTVDGRSKRKTRQKTSNSARSLSSNIKKTIDPSNRV